jgi:hypothetical protein
LLNDLHLLQVMQYLNIGNLRAETQLADFPIFLSAIVSEFNQQNASVIIDEASSCDSPHSLDDAEPIFITVWLYLICAVYADSIKFGITAAETQGRDGHASTYFSTCWSIYFPLPV